MIVCRKAKDDHLTGVSIAPNKQEPTYKAWKTKNDMVISWLINFTNNNIEDNFLLYGPAKEIWEGGCKRSLFKQ